MRDIVKEYQEKFRRNHQRARRYTALLLALALTTSLFVNWQLHGVGIAKTAEYLCGEVEHEHTAACYEKQLVCGYEEGEPEDWNSTMTDDGTSFDDTFGMDDDAFGVDADDPGIAAYSAEPEYIFVPHEHTSDCYQEVQELTCLEEEHTHTDDCFDPEDGSLICDLFEHTHDDSCYTTTYELVCGLEEGELVEEVNPDYDPVALFEEPVAAKPVVVDPVIETPVHHHTDACYEEVLVCGLPEHHHTVNCLADPLDGTQDEDEWLAQTGTSLTGLWMDDLLAVAESQLGYEQSEKNFELDDADGTTVHYYTRYGAWYGNSYGPWDVTFLSYCLNYAGIPQSAIPQVSSVLSLHSQLRSALYNEETGSGYAMDFDGDLPSDAAMPGDIVIYNGTVTKAVAVESEPLQVQDDSADADIALLSMDAAAATDTAPHIEEYTVDASTVGIVSDVDEDSGTLTVISGDVDGKVDKVTLNASQVTTLVSVANAQQADYGVATLDFKAEDDNTTGLDITSKITNACIEKKEDGGWVPSNHFTTKDQVRAFFKFEDISASELLQNGRKAYIPLPDGIDCSKILSGGKIEDSTYTAGNGYSGTYHFEQVGDHYVVVLEYDEAYIDERAKEQATVSGDVSFEFSWDKNKIDTNGQNTITMGGHTLTITIKDKDTPIQDTDHFSIKKESSNLTMNGTTAVIKYSITVEIKDQMNGPLVLEDVLKAPEGFSYSGTPSFKENYGNIPISWADNATGNGKTITLGGEDTVFNPGKYKIVYEVHKENFGDKDYTQDDAVTNKVTMTKDGETHEKDTKTSITTKLIEKTGEASTGENGKTYITWTVKLNYGSSKRNLKNAAFTDTIPNDQKLVEGSFTVKKNDKAVANPDVTIDGNSITYSLADGFNSYEITYQTEVTKDIPLDGTTITNTGEIKGNGLSGQDTGKVKVTKSVLSKSAVGSPTISSGIATLRWTSHIDVIDLNGYVYTDYSGGFWTQEKSHFCPQKIDLESIRVTDSNGKDVTAQLNGKIKEYQHKQDGVDLGLFQIDFSGTSITGPVDITYNTTVDLSVLPQDPVLTNFGTLTKDGHSQSVSANQTITTMEDNWKSLHKYAGNSWTTENSGSTKLEIGEKLPWTVWLNVGGVITESRGDWVVEDTLPAGMLLDKTSIALDFNGSSPVLGTDYTIDTYTNPQGRTVLRIVLKESAYKLSDGSVQKRIKLTYDTTLDPDSAFCKGDQKQADFTNDVSFTHDGKRENDSFTETVTRNIIGKHGSYDSSTGLLTYTIEVNPDGATLANGNPLDLEDSLNIPDTLREQKGGRAGFVSLEGITVFRGERQSDGSLIAGACLRALSKAASQNAADLSSYYTKFDSDKSHLLFYTKVEDSTPLVLVAQYSVKDKVDNFTPDGTFTFKNTVKLAGNWEQNDVAQDATFSSGAHSSLDYNHDRVTVVKYSNNQSNPLAGAKFELKSYDHAAQSWSRVQTLSTGSMGTLVFGSLNRNVLYCLQETEAPYGYLRDSTPTYFYITPSLTENPLPADALDIYGTLLDSGSVIVYTVQAGVFQNFFFYRNNVRDETIVQKGELLVNKNWQNHDGSAVEDPSDMPEVIVTLTKHSPSYVTVTFTGSSNTSDSIKVPKGSSLTTQANRTRVTVEGTVDFSEGTDSSGQYFYYFKNIQSDLTVSMPSFYMNRWILAQTTVDTSNASSDTESTIIGTVQLDKTNHWSYRWKDLETGDGITYSVTEQPVTGYTTTYQLNSNAIEAGTHFSLSDENGDKVSITNTAEESGGYVLPSTGGAGTKLYTAGGGALMLAALVCGVCRKRRRERRAR